ncbi:MAG: zinc ribbon domain-containing protein [Candidatus Coatesbacteria bacterium]|nr:zinc ribbon domain-containing protein [Candidatus Coatesbacteria bacterium]
MPTYRFRCAECSEEFERFLSITAPDPESCPLCGAEGSIKRLPAAGSGLIFKGGGFYITDNRPESYKEAAQAENKGDTDKGSASEACESCPAAESCAERD